LTAPLAGDTFVFMELWVGLFFLSLPCAVVALVFYFQFAYAESKMAWKIGRRFEMAGERTGLTRPGWLVTFHNRPKDRSTEYLMGYEVHLEGLPSGFSLMQRGATSAMVAQHGAASERSGDEDFDGLFHFQGTLKPGQRGLLIDLWQLLPEFQIGQQKISGEVQYEQSPQGFARLVKVLERLRALQVAFPTAEVHARTLPVGFVRRQKLSQESTFCWAGAAIAGAPAMAYATYAGVAGFWPLDPATLGCLLMLATALGFVNCAFKVSRGSYAAVAALEMTRKLALVSGLVVFPQLVRTAPSPIGAAFVSLMMLIFIHMTLGQLKQKWEGVLDR